MGSKRTRVHGKGDRGLKKQKLTDEELARMRNLWDILHNPARMFITLSTPESATASWNEETKKICDKYGFSQMTSNINLQDGFIYQEDTI